MHGVFLANVSEDGWSTDGIPPPLSYGMGFEFDPEKDAKNRSKHGYGLASGEDLLRRITEPWHVGPPVVGLTQHGRIDGEPRFRLLTLDHECELVDFVFTVRGEMGANYAMRAISYRRASYDPYWMAVYVRNVSLEEVLLWERQSARAELIDGAPSWQTTDAIEPHRRARLEQAIPRDALIGRLLEHSRLITPELGKPLMESSDARELADYKRLRLDWVATTPAGLAAFDYLFNGRDGLRGHYARSPVLGELFARELLLGARGFAIAAIKDSSEAFDLATASYDAISTKVWPSEGTLQLAPPAAAVPAIAVPSWIGALGAWRADPASASMVAGWGVQAPGVSRLEIKGGFRRADGVEWIPARKLHRADELHRYGWS